jgi:hypothetical protein
MFTTSKHNEGMKTNTVAFPIALRRLQPFDNKIIFIIVSFCFEPVIKNREDDICLKQGKNCEK